MADYTKPDFEEVQERVHLFETSSEREMTESDTVLGYQHMNTRYLQKEHDDVWRDDIKERQREWKERKKAHDRRKKEIERAWHNNTRERKAALEARKGSNSPKEKNYYRNYDLKEMGIVFLVPIIVAFGVASYGIFIYCGAPIGQESSAAVVWPLPTHPR